MGRLQQAVVQLQEFLGLTSQGGGGSGLVDRVAYLERDVGDSFEKHVKALQELQSSHEAHKGGVGRHHASTEERLAFVEKSLGDSADTARMCTDLRRAHDRHARDLGELKDAHSSHHASVPERVAFLEKEFGDSADKHARMLTELKRSHDKHAQELSIVKGAHGHHATFEERIEYIESAIGDSAVGKALAEMKKAHDRHVKDMQAHTSIHASLPERIEFIEKELGDSADKHARMLADLKRSHDSLRAAHEQHHATLPERVGYLEKEFGDSADKHGKQLQELHKKHEELNKKHVSIPDRVAFLEQEIGDSADKHARLTTEIKSHGELKRSHAKHVTDSEARHGSLEQRMGYMEKEMGDSFDEHAKQLNEVKKAHDKHAGHIDTVKSWKMHHASMEERMGYLEKVLNDSADQHARMMTDMKNKHEELRSSHSRHAPLEERVASLENDAASVDQHRVLDDVRTSYDRILRDNQSRHAGLDERLAFVESAVGDSAHKHQASIDALRQAQGKCARDLESVMAMHDKHASFIDRLDAVENIYRDSISQIGVLKTGYGNLANDLAALRKLSGSGTTNGSGMMEERLLNVERLIRQELSSAHEQLDVLAQSVQTEALSKLELSRGTRRTDAQVTQVIRSISPDPRVAQSYSRDVAPGNVSFTTRPQTPSGLISPIVMVTTPPAARAPVPTQVPVPVATVMRSEPIALVRNDSYGGVTPLAFSRVAP